MVTLNQCDTACPRPVTEVAMTKGWCSLKYNGCCSDWQLWGTITCIEPQSDQFFQHTSLFIFTIFGQHRKEFPCVFLSSSVTFTAKYHAYMLFNGNVFMSYLIRWLLGVYNNALHVLMEMLYKLQINYLTNTADISTKFCRW